MILRKHKCNSVLYSPFQFFLNTYIKIIIILDKGKLKKKKGSEENDMKIKIILFNI